MCVLKDLISVSIDRNNNRFDRTEPRVPYSSFASFDPRKDADDDALKTCSFDERHDVKRVY